MDWQKLVEAALLLVIRFALVWFFNLINYPIDPAILDSIVAAIVAWLLSQIFAQLGVRAFRSFFLAK